MNNMSKFLSVLLLFLMFLYVRLNGAEELVGIGSREITEALDQPSRHDWLRSQMKLRVDLVGPDLTVIALDYAAVNLATKANDASALVYLARRLTGKVNPEEKVDIIGKLTRSPGVEEFYPLTVPLIINVIQPEEMREVKTFALNSLRIIVDKSPVYKTQVARSEKRIQEAFASDSNGLKLLAEILNKGLAKDGMP